MSFHTVSMGTGMGKARRERYEIELVRPEGVGKLEMRDYIREAVASWRGQYMPDDPRFDIGSDPIRVRSKKK